MKRLYLNNLKNRLLGLAKAPIISNRKSVRIELIRTDSRSLRSSILGSFRSSQKTNFSSCLGILFPFLIMTAIPAWTENITIQEIVDESRLPLLNPDLASRTTAKIRLSNGLEAYIISDPLADQSAASMTVQVGSWSDPVEYPGMAHFCEHMLFKGSQKYPSETEFFSLITDHNGQANAFTSSDRTVYMFSSCEEGFLTTLDRFARFFIDPLFNPNGIGREMHAVDQEFAKNIENDGWRENMVFKETGNPNHPNAMFSIGNSQTLSNIPQIALKKWHSQYYIAPKMRLVVYSQLPVDTLKETIRNFFGSIPNHPSQAVNYSEPLTSEKQKGHFIYIQPIKDVQSITLLWELPPEFAQDPTKSAQLFSYAMGRGQPFSLHEQLKKDGYIVDLDVDVDQSGDANHYFFQVNLDLTALGLKQIDDVILRVFQTIHSLKASGIPEYLFEEMNQIHRLSYQYHDRENAFRFVTKIGSTILDEPIASFPRKHLLASEYDSEKIDRVGAFLTPENCIYFLKADFTKMNISLDQKERWIGANYAVREIAIDRLNAWKNANPHPNIRLALPNPFLATNFNLVPQSEDSTSTTPSLLHEDDSGIAYYCRIPEFCTPESVFDFSILSPEINSSPRSHCLMALYINYLKDRIHPTIVSAASAGIKSEFSRDRNRLHCRIVGFSDKTPLLLQEILKQLSLPPPTPEQFEQYVTHLSQELANQSKDLAVLQAKELVSSIIYLDAPTQKAQLEALQSISYDDFCNFLHILFDQTYVQALFSGNLSLKDAESAWLDVRHLLGGNPFPKKDHIPTKILSLPNDQGPFAIHEKVDVLGNAAFLVIDVGTFNFEKRAAQEILGAVLRDSFFDTLRSKQKTGYIAQADHQELDLRLFQYFLVQSNSHQPEELLARFELFLETFLQELPEIIPESRFSTLKQNIAESLLTRFRSLKEKSTLWNHLAFDNDADFAWVEKRLTGFAHLNYETFLKEAKTFLSRDNHKRLAVLFEGRIDSPLIYKPATPQEISQQSGYYSRSDIATQLDEPKKD